MRKMIWWILGIALVLAGIVLFVVRNVSGSPDLTSKPSVTQDGLQDLSLRAFSAKPYPAHEQSAALAVIQYLEASGESRGAFYVSFAPIASGDTMITMYLTHKSLYTDEGIRIAGDRGDFSGKTRTATYDISNNKITNVTTVR